MSEYLTRNRDSRCPVAGVGGGSGVGGQHGPAAEDAALSDSRADDGRREHGHREERVEEDDVEEEEDAEIPHVNLVPITLALEDEQLDYVEDPLKSMLMIRPGKRAGTDYPAKHSDFSKFRNAKPSLAQLKEEVIRRMKADRFHEPVVSESAYSSFWHKCTLGADREAEIFNMLPRRGVGPVVPGPEGAVDQFAGLSCARPQPGFAGKASVLRMPLSSCPGLWPPFAVSLGLMHFHQYLLDGGACLHLVARAAHRDRHFLKPRPPPSRFSDHVTVSLARPSSEAPNSYCDRRPRELT